MLENEVTKDALRKKSDRANEARAGAVNGDARTGGEAVPWGRRYTRERSVLRDAAGPKRRATGADRSAGAAPSTVRGGDGLPEA